MEKEKETLFLVLKGIFDPDGGLLTADRRLLADNRRLPTDDGTLARTVRGAILSLGFKKEMEKEFFEFLRKNDEELKKSLKEKGKKPISQIVKKFLRENGAEEFFGESLEEKGGKEKGKTLFSVLNLILTDAGLAATVHATIFKLGLKKEMEKKFFEFLRKNDEELKKSLKEEGKKISLIVREFLRENGAEEFFGESLEEKEKEKTLSSVLKGILDDEKLAADVYTTIFNLGLKKEMEKEFFEFLRKNDEELKKSLKIGGKKPISPIVREFLRKNDAEEFFGESLEEKEKEKTLSSVLKGIFDDKKLAADVYATIFNLHLKKEMEKKFFEFLEENNEELKESLKIGGEKPTSLIVREFLRENDAGRFFGKLLKGEEKMELEGEKMELEGGGEMELEGGEEEKWNLKKKEEWKTANLLVKFMNRANKHYENHRKTKQIEKKPLLNGKTFNQRRGK